MEEGTEIVYGQTTLRNTELSKVEQISLQQDLPEPVHMLLCTANFQVKDIFQTELSMEPT